MFERHPLLQFSLAALLLCSSPSSARALGPSSADASAAVETLGKAARAGDVATALGLLENGANPNQSDRYGTTPLFHAVSFNQARVVELLLKYQADPSLPVRSGEFGFPATPLQAAAYMGNLQIASALVDAGAHLNARTSTGRSALHFAVLAAHVDVLRYLIDKGADLNTRDADGGSPLDDAVWRGYLDAVAILLANGARLNEAETKTGATPVNEAAYKGDTRLVQYLLRFGPDLDTPDKKGYRPLENAARRGNEGSAALLLADDIKRRKAPAVWAKTLEVATRKDEAALVQTLVHAGVSPNAPLPSGATPLDTAVSFEATKTVEVLLSNGAEPNTRGSNGVGPLEDASLKGFSSIAALLLDHGARVNQVNAGSGTTALYAAASFGRAEVVTLLLGRGADPNLCGSKGRTPYQAALDNGYGSLAAEIKRHGGSAACARAARSASEQRLPDL